MTPFELMQQQGSGLDDPFYEDSLEQFGCGVIDKGDGAGANVYSGSGLINSVRRA